MGGGSVPTIPVPWDRLRAWINDQEALEKQQGRTTLTRSQIQMLSVFVNFLDDEPQFEAGEDYVSRLMLRTKDIESPTFEDLNPVEVPINGSFFQRWQTVCYLNHVSPTPKKFPALGYGIEDEKKGIPMFKSKKLAKQYAAKYAYSYLRGEPPSIPSAQSSAQSGLAEGGASLTPTFTPTTNARGILSAPPTLLGPASGKASPSPASRDAATSDGNKPVSNTPGLLVKSMGCLEIAEKSNNDFSNEDSSAIVGRVAALSGRLGLESPTYHVEEEVNNPGFFSGQPIFKDSLYPPDLGIVAGVMGKKNAKTAIARALLVWLEGEKRRRDGMINEVLGGLDQEAKTETERQSDTI